MSHYITRNAELFSMLLVAAAVVDKAFWV